MIESLLHQNFAGGDNRQVPLFVRKKRDDVNLGDISNNQSDRGSFPQNTVVYQI